MGVSIEIFKVHTFFNMSTTPQAFFFYITLKRTLCHEKWYQFHFSTMICVGITTSVAFFLSTTVHPTSLYNTDEQYCDQQLWSDSLYNRRVSRISSDNYHEVNTITIHLWTLHCYNIAKQQRKTISLEQIQVLTI